MIGSGENLEAQFSMESGTGRIIEDQPFFMLVTGDWSADATRKPLDNRSVTEVDRDNCDEVLARVAPVLDLEINGHRISLNFLSIDDFHPDRLFAQVPLFAELRSLRSRLKSGDTFNEAAREMRSRFDHVEPTAAVKPEPAVPDELPNDLLGQILSQPTGGARPKSAVSGELAGLLDELVRPHLVNVDEDEQRSMLDAVDKASGDLMRAILHDHKFRELEAAWRGLFFLVRRAETDANLKVFILDMTHDELSENLKSESDLSETRLYDLIAGDPPYGPWAAVIGNYGFRPVIDDIAALIRVSKICAAAAAPFISHMRPEILGVHSLADGADPKTWNTSPDTAEGKLWSTLRSMPESEYLGMTIPRFLGRLPYGAETDPLETFQFEEFEDGPVHDKFAWVNCAFGCAALLTQNFSANGWEIGTAFVQDLERLPVYTHEEGGQTVYQPCAEVLLSHSAADALSEYGLMPLVTFKNTDHVRLTRFQSITDPPTVLRGRWRSGQS
ncbi:MAG: type VI secretion system contractile sheath large subunit [Acidobacteriota bacterium]